MVERLVLVRHAKTEARSPEVPDRARKLTAAGERSAKAALPAELAPLALASCDPVAIWSSPAARARQTAEIVASVIGAGPAEVHDSLYQSNADALFAELAQARGTVIAVGHNPFLEELYNMLAGHRQQLGKASCACFLFDDEGAARLSWFAQGPDHARWKTLVELERALAQAGKAISAAAWAFLDDPDDPESLHRYRVALRTARSLSAFAEPWQKRKQQQKTAALLKRLQRPTSHLRELDVLAETLASREPDASDDALAAACETARIAERARFSMSMRSRRTQAAVHDAAQLLAHVEWRAHVESLGLARADVQRHFDELSDAYEEAFDACDFADAEQTHAVRKQSKQLRYVAREFGALLDTDRADEARKRAKSAQERLGRLCDARVNAELAAKLRKEAAANSFGALAQDEPTPFEREQTALALRLAHRAVRTPQHKAPATASAPNASCAQSETAQTAEP